jgi:hypothetical protein
MLPTQIELAKLFFSVLFLAVLNTSRVTTAEYEDCECSALEDRNFHDNYRWKINNNKQFKSLLSYFI